MRWDVYGERIYLFNNYWVNRISFGLESTNKKHLEFLKRDFDKRQVITIVNYSKSVGIDNINIDLIYALKDQTIEEIKEDLDFIIDLDIKHISTYSLIIEKNTLLSVLGTKNISEDLDLEVIDETNEEPLEIDNINKKENKQFTDLEVF